MVAVLLAPISLIVTPTPLRRLLAGLERAASSARPPDPFVAGLDRWRGCSSPPEPVEFRLPGPAAFSASVKARTLTRMGLPVR